MGASSTHQPLCAIAWGEADSFMVKEEDGIRELHGRAFALLPGGTMFNARKIAHGIAGIFCDGDEDVYVIADDGPPLDIAIEYLEAIRDSLLIAEQYLPS